MSYRFAYGKTPNELEEALLIEGDDYLIVTKQTAPTELKRAKRSALLMPSNLVYINTVTPPAYDTVVLADNPFCFIPFHSEAVPGFTTHAGARFRYGVGDHSVAFKYPNRVIKGYGNAMGFGTDGSNVLALSRASHVGFDIYQNRTIEFWLKYTVSTGNSQQFIADQQQFGEEVVSSTRCQFSINSNSSYFSTTGNKLGWFSNHPSTSNEFRLVSNAVLVNNSIYHIVFTLTTTTLSLYINGVLDKSQTHSQASKSTTGNVIIGRGAQSNAAPEVPNGTFSGFAFYDYALSADKILAHYNAGKI